MPRTHIQQTRPEPELVPELSRYGDSEGRLARLEGCLSIDRNRLEQACVGQPDYIHQVADEVALVRSRRDAKKKELDEKEAALYVEIRHRASVHEDRITEAEVKAQMTLDRERRRLSNELMRCNELLARWEALKEAFSQRSYMLKELVSLYLARYYGDPARGAEYRMRDFATDRVREARRERNGHSREE